MPTQITVSTTVLAGDTLNIADAPLTLIGSASLSNYGTINLAVVNSQSTAVVGYSGGSAGTFLNAVGATLTITGSYGARAYYGEENVNTRLTAFINNGVINVSGPMDAQGVHVAAGADYPGLPAFSFTNTGEIHVSSSNSAFQTYGLYVSLANVENSGLIDVNGYNAVAVDQSNGFLTLHNSGTIHSSSIGLSLNSLRGASIVNSGLIDAPSAIVASDASEALRNTGQIHGSIDLEGGADSFTNAGTVNGSIWLGAGDDTYNGAGGTQDYPVLGGDGDDVLIGGSGADVLAGQVGNDVILAGAGDDFVDGGLGDDILDGGAGFDTLSYASQASATLDLSAGTAEAGHDRIRNFERVVGSSGSDTMTGSNAAETLEGRDGADTLSGGGGADLLIGGHGADIMTGGSGDDTFLFAAGDGADTITDFQAGGSEDRVAVWGYTGYQSATQQGADTLVTFATGDTILLKNVSAGLLTSADFDFHAGAYVAPDLPSIPYASPVTTYLTDLINPSGATFALEAAAITLTGVWNSPKTASLYNAGTMLFHQPMGGTGIISTSASSDVPGYIYNQAGGVISVSGNSVLGIDAAGARVYNLGVINIDGGPGYGTGVTAFNGYIFVNNEMHVTGALYAKGFAGATNYVYNTGLMDVTSSGGPATGIAAKYATVINSGTLHVSAGAGQAATGVEINSDGGSPTPMFNSGVITADIAIKGVGGGNRDLSIYNSGQLNGTVDLNPTVSSYYSAGHDKLYNTGSILGRIDMGWGDDTYDGRGGTESGGVYGGTGNDTLLGGTGADSLYGGDGDDRISGGAGSDTLTGGAGNDHFRYEAGSGADVIADFVAGGTDDDIEVVGYSSYQSAVQQGADTLVTFAAGSTLLLKNVQASSLTASDFVFSATAIAAATWPTPQAALSPPTVPTLPAATNLVLGADSGETLDGTSAPDIIVGYAGADQIIGHAGADRLLGGEGADTFVYSSGDGGDLILDFDATQGDTLRLQGFSDYSTAVSGGDLVVSVTGGGSITLRGAVAGESGIVLVPSSGFTINEGGSSTDNLTGGSGRDLLRGGAGDDALHGGAGADRLEGGLGNDILEGGQGDDDLVGGAGADTFVLNVGDGGDVIRDFDAAQGDSITINGFLAVTISQSESVSTDVYVSGFGATPGGFLLHNATVGQVTAAVHAVIAMPSGPAVSGTPAGELIDGTAGGDIIDARAGSDEIRAGAGDDVVYGGAGNDIIEGGAGNDQLTGGPGADIFIYRPGDGFDVIRDFNPAEGDVLRMEGYGPIDYSVSYQGGSVYVTIPGNPGMLLLENSYVDLSAVISDPSVIPNAYYTGNYTGTSGGETLSGTAADDAIVGLQGNDTLYGGDGSDLLAGGSGSDVLYGGNGPDILAGYGTDNGTAQAENASDTMTGGAGADYFVIFPSDGADVVTDFEVSQDVIDVRRVTITAITQVGADTVISFGGSNSLTLKNVNYLNLTPANFHGSTTTAPIRPALHNVAPGDFNLDGKSDVLWRNDNGELYVWNSKAGQGAFLGQSLGNPGAQWHVQAIGDYDGDGKADVLWRNNTGNLYVYRSDDGAGVSFTGQTISYVDPVWQVVPHAGDFDGDGRADILYRNSNTGEVYLWNSNTGADISFVGQSLGAISSSWHIQGVDDFNGDGKADVLWRSDGGDVYVWTAAGGNNSVYMNGQSISSVGNDWSIIGTGDFNGDGRADILWRHTDGELYVWNSNTNADVSFLGQSLGMVGLDWSVAAIGDYDGDGRADILFRNSDGRVYVWNSNDSGAVGFVGQGLGTTPNEWHIMSDFHVM